MTRQRGTVEVHHFGIDTPHILTDADGLASVPPTVGIPVHIDKCPCQQWSKAPRRCPTCDGLGVVDG